MPARYAAQGKQGTLFMWADGGTAGSGSTSDANPYAHFSYDFLETLSATPTYTGAIASSIHKFVSYTGSSSYADLRNASLYKGIGAYGYLPKLPTSLFNYICEVRSRQHQMAQGAPAQPGCRFSVGYNRFLQRVP